MVPLVQVPCSYYLYIYIYRIYISPILPSTTSNDTNWVCFFCIKISYSPSREGWNTESLRADLTQRSNAWKMVTGAVVSKGNMFPGDANLTLIWPHRIVSTYNKNTNPAKYCVITSRTCSFLGSKANIIASHWNKGPSTIGPLAWFLNEVPQSSTSTFQGVPIKP